MNERSDHAPLSAAGSAAPGVETDFATVLRAWWRIGVAAVVAGQSMVLSLGVNATDPEGAAYWMVHGGLIGAALIVCALLLPALVREAWSALCQRRASVEFLFLLTLLGAFAASLTSSLNRVGDVYYEVVSILLAVYSAGKTLGARSRAKALRAVEETRERFDRAERMSGEIVAIAQLRIGEHVRVRPGGAIGVDGIVRAGASFVRETAMTGEWRPGARGPGDPVLAGTFAIDGELEIEVTAAGGQRQLDAVLAAVAEAQLAPSELQRTSDRLTAWFLPLVLLISLATFVFWTARAGWVQGVFNSMAVLLVACPCALGLATPLAVFRGLARFAELGLVARTGDAIDQLARADHVCFDKTGTLSEEELDVRAWRIEPAFAEFESWIRAAVVAAERGLPHPIARAIAASESSATPSPAVRAANVRVVPGCGIIAVVDGRELRVGSLNWIEPSRLVARGDRAIAVGVDGGLAAIVELTERWRTGTAEVFQELRGLGFETEILSGDPGWTEATLHDAAVRAGLSPEAKREHVAALSRNGRRVLFVGDGINDASAMTEASFAIAMGGGASLARAAAPAVFLGRDLSFLPAAIRLARALRQGVASNLRFAAVYNVVGMALAATGLLHPVIAALLMLGSSAFVAVRTLRT